MEDDQLEGSLENTLMEDQTITTNEEADAALATMSQNEMQQFIRGLLHSEDFDSGALRRHLSAFLSANPSDRATAIP